MKKEYKLCFYMILFNILLFIYSGYVSSTKGYEHTIIPFFELPAIVLAISASFLGGISLFLLIVIFIFNKLKTIK